MEKNEHDKIIAFDTLFTTNHIQMLKIVMPYFDNPIRKNLAIYIKYLELSYTLSYCEAAPYELCGCSMEKEEFDINKICTEILPFCTNEEKKKIEQIAGIFHSLEKYQEISRTFEMMKDLMPDFNTDSPNKDSAGDNAMLNMLMNMLSPEQKSMFEMFGGNLHESK